MTRMPEVPPAVVLGGGAIAVPVARSLARSKSVVYALGHRLDPVRASRACHRFVALGADADVQERWLDWLDGRNAAGAVLMPGNDDAVELIGRARGVLTERGYRPVTADDGVLLAMLDKAETYRLADAVGVRTPRHTIARPDDDIEALAEPLEFPLALKPRHGHVFARYFGLRQKGFVVKDLPELLVAHRSLREVGLEALLTEIVPGTDDSYHSYYTYVDETGRPLFDFTKRKLRQYSPGFGLGTFHITDRHEETIELGRRFVTEIGLRGLACVEFKIDARDGGLTLIECNPRFTAGNELVRYAGIDMATLAFNREVGIPDPPVDRYRTGLRMWHPIEDVRGFLAYRRAGVLTFAGWRRSLLHRQHFPMFSWSDPLPTVFSLSRVLFGRSTSKRPTARGGPLDVTIRDSTSKDLSLTR